MIQLKRKKIFFLGGYDAEMCEIRKILEENNLPFFDKHLSWGARVSEYREELASLGNKIPVFIELEMDMPVPENSIIIDHHEKAAGADKPTSIEQIAQLLGISLNRWQKLIAANDRGWIDELKAFGATDEEIEQVRRYDRKCQGVTEEEEKLAEVAIQNLKVINGIAVIEIPFRHISPVTDRLYGKYANMLIITPESINFSGDGRLVLKLAEAFPQGWYGGNLPEKGFWGSRIENFKNIKIENLLSLMLESLKC